MMENHPVQFFGAIWATSGIWQHIAIFAWWDVQVIFNPDTIKLDIKKLNFIFYHFQVIPKNFLGIIISHIVN